MEISSKDLRKLALRNIDSNVGEECVENNELENFLYMLRYYCIETGTNESEVLNNDILYNRVHNIFKKHKPFIKNKCKELV